MKKRALFAGAAVVAITLGIVGMSAFEAHVINVTAQIENALNVPLKAIEFGTVFPQEELDEQFTIAMSDSFVAENRVDDIDYLIKQKPKCIGTAEGEGEDTIEYGLVVHDPATGEFTCADAGFTIMPVLCPYLSKHDGDPADQNDYELDAFHGPIGAWDNDDTTQWAVNGRLAKSEGDTEDLWILDLKVPCFEGMCAQDWNSYVTGINPQADPAAYVQPADNEHELFGCDLWIEVGGISRLGDFDRSLTLENKDADYNWMIEQDEFKATLLYNECGPEFAYKLTGKAMNANSDYYLIYYADGWPGNNPGFKIADVLTDANGDFAIDGSIALGMDLPHSSDANSPDGAKIWLVPANDYDPGTFSMTAWNPTQYLYEYNLIQYSLVCTP